MKAPPLLRDRDRPMQVLSAVVMPIVFGAFCGFLLGSSALWFQIVMALGAIGGLGAGFEHEGARGGFLRGISGGVLFALGLVGMHGARGVPQLAVLPATLPVMAVFYAVMGGPIGTLGGVLRARFERRAGALTT